jgi:hypothetical protein
MKQIGLITCYAVKCETVGSLKMDGNMPWPKAFVSDSAHIGRKRETKGNETGNGDETKRDLLCNSGNEQETRIGNEAPFLSLVRFLSVFA